MAVAGQRGTAAPDWDPARYAAFAGLRLRPALDLLAQVPGALPSGGVVDLGCGNGAAGGALRLRFPDRVLTGLDASPAMLAATSGYDHLIKADIADWQPAAPPALIFSNAALQWLPDHDRLFPHLAGLLPIGGVLAVQMPRNHLAPSHALLRDVASQLFPDRFPASAAYHPPVDAPRAYWDRLSAFGAPRIWETEYLQDLQPVDHGHPVRRFTESTAMRPVLAQLDAAEGAALTAAYDRALLAAYPLLPGGGALFPFRRLFMILQRTV